MFSWVKSKFLIIPLLGFVAIFAPAHSFVPVAQGVRTPLTGDLSQMKYFYDGLNQSRTKKLRIGHWGDSIILGDIITMSIRDNLQQKYGGNGVGFVTMNVDDFGMRNSTVVTFSNDWKEGSLFKRNPDKLPIGMGGAVYLPTDQSWVKYEIGKVSRTQRSFTTVRVFYSNANGGGKINYQFNNGSVQSMAIPASKEVKEVSFTSSSPATSVRLTFSGCSSTYFYGVSLENGSGIFVDNLPIRGNSGISLLDISKDYFTRFNSLMNYKLLLIHFGVNVLAPEHKDYMWYETRMERVINYLKECFPQTSIVLISVSDKGFKKGTRFVTDPMIPALINVQRSIASKTKIAFWNMFDAMGGNNTIVDWVSKAPPLANKDYCHLTAEGGKVVADLFTQALIDEYSKYK